MRAFRSAVPVLLAAPVAGVHTVPPAGASVPVCNSFDCTLTLTNTDSGTACCFQAVIAYVFGVEGPSFAGTFTVTFTGPGGSRTYTCDSVPVPAVASCAGASAWTSRDPGLGSISISGSSTGLGQVHAFIHGF
jgi:hypothetical protein